MKENIRRRIRIQAYDGDILYSHIRKKNVWYIQMRSFQYVCTGYVDFQHIQFVMNHTRAHTFQKQRLY